MRPELKYGLISGASVCLWIILEYLLGFHSTRMAMGEYFGIISNLIPLVPLFLLLRFKQAGFYDHRLNLATGVGSGIFASFVAALVVYCFLTTYTRFINPAWIDQTVEWKVAQFRLAQVPEASIRERIMLYRETYTPVGLVTSIIVNSTLMGGVCSIALTLLINRLPRRTGA